MGGKILDISIETVQRPAGNVKIPVFYFADRIWFN